MDQIRSAILSDFNIPKPFIRLQELAYNLWWSWTPQARRLFSHIHPELWNHYRNPVELLINVDAYHWNPLLQSDAFLSEYLQVLRDFDHHMNPARESWFHKAYPNYSGGPVAYFCSEYGFSEALHLYSGGLGILAGDTCKSMDHLGVPFIAVGLMYRSGFFDQVVDMDGSQHHVYRAYDFSRLPVTLVQTQAGRELLVKVPLTNREIYVRVWHVQVGRVPVLLLDSDVVMNDPADRPITSQLYVTGREMRLCQEIILGIGGVQVLRELGVNPSIWHLNEGHSVFLVVERIRERMRETGCAVEEALRHIRGSTVFTTHTPVMAGHEAFDADLIEKYFSTPETRLGLTANEFYKLGSAFPDKSNGQPFSLTALAIRTSAVFNGVSRLHADVTKTNWGPLRSATAAGPDDSGVDSVTNGVHILSWLGTDIREMYERHFGQEWTNNWRDPEEWARQIETLPDQEIWEVHESQRMRLMTFVKRRLLAMFSRHGHSPDELRLWQELIDGKALWIGFARRFAGYKRAGMIFNDIERLRTICTAKDRPVCIVFSGKAHPSDREGQDLIRHIFGIVQNSPLRGHVFFIENYDMNVARRLVQGVDVWLNNPIRPMEASGTSGIKAAINGVLNLSIPDGWWCEGYNGENGWRIGDGAIHSDSGHQDWVDACALYDLLEKEVVPLFYDRTRKGLPAGWIKRMRSALVSITHQFSSARMCREYVDTIYRKAPAWPRAVEEKFTAEAQS